MIRFAAMDILHKISVGDATAAVGHHKGLHDIRDGYLYPDEVDIVNALSPRKRSEWLASRELLFKIAGLPERVQCLYDDFGKPYLKGINRPISVSHSELWCAAMICDKPCGVDIQVYSDTVRRIADRFLTSDDLAMVRRSNNTLHYLHLYWGAKECMYKAYGKKKLGFREHIFITDIMEEKDRGVGEIRYEGIHLSYDIYFRMLPEVAWVFCIERPAGPTLPGGKL
jgi:4'-phosphopantetheinyl transferase